MVDHKGKVHAGGKAALRHGMFEPDTLKKECRRIQGT